MTDVLVEITESPPVYTVIEEVDGGTTVVEHEPGVQTIKFEVPGPAGPPGPPGPPGPLSQHYEHDQASAASVWTITHGLGYWPHVTFWNRSGKQLQPGVENVDNFVVKAYFTNLTAGYALCE